jgi:ferritin
MEQIKKIIVSIQFDAEEMVAGESAKPNRTHLMKLAAYFNVKNANALIDEVQNVVNNWKKYAALYGVKNTSKSEIQKIIGLRQF